MSAMDKMWVSLIGIGLMALAAFLITFARYKTKGIIKFTLSIIAFFTLVIGFFHSSNHTYVTHHSKKA